MRMGRRIAATLRRTAIHAGPAERGIIFFVEHVFARFGRAQDVARMLRLFLRHAQLHSADRQTPFPIRQGEVFVAQVRVDALRGQQAAGDMRFDRIVVVGDGNEHKFMPGRRA